MLEIDIVERLIDVTLTGITSKADFNTCQSSSSSGCTYQDYSLDIIYFISLYQFEN